MLIFCFFRQLTGFCVYLQDDEFTFHGIAYVDMSPLIYPGGMFSCSFSTTLFYHLTKIIKYLVTEQNFSTRHFFSILINAVGW